MIETTGMTEAVDLTETATETVHSRTETARAEDSERILLQVDLAREPVAKEDLITEMVRAANSQARTISSEVSLIIKAAQEAAPLMLLQQKRAEATEMKKDVA